MQRSAHALLHVPGGGGCVSGAGSSTLCGVTPGFQEPYQHPATVDDVCRYPPVGRNACNEEEVRWFGATYAYLEAQLDDAELAKRMLPAKKQRRGGRSATRRPPPQPCLLPRRPQEREPLRGPHARMTRMTTTDDFMYQNSVCTYCAYFAYLLYSAFQTYFAYFAGYIFCILLIFYVVQIHFALVAACLWILVLYHDSSERAIGIHLQNILPKLVPKTDAEVDELLDCKLRVYVVHILHILHI
jgi:hypothetical protein